ncbi:ABC transporter ATP-binding protein [Gordonia sp. (in: high G+C Gram-positive bacteria)]|uniref:ABC transporter ATP-binding protein n=1 Tax=Gordonia sp. (in: high G+C Gram-positive bacteria) TaxID=84139 RepID=UPI0016BA5C5C|nr:ABC transporter ATP-binding protein [Gordonia sp. (in: high G+C Gram-positive bacteria)]NLG46002.1 ABC transporter ATP-binding protein [Gordonia sp. (in: high G+C Gram-positive bacteria)]
MTVSVEVFGEAGTPPTQGAPCRLAAEKLSVGYGDTTIIDRLDVAIPTGQVTTIVGPNGCGKSTLLRTLSRLLNPSAGQVLLDGQDIAGQKPKQVARTLGLLPQNPVAPDGLTVADLVARGRHPHQSWYRQWSSDDDRAVAEAMALTSTTELADRAVDSLSGGQRQRVWIAMTLAQQTDLVLLDEPTTYLDLAHAVDVLDLVDELRSEHGKTVVMVLHDLNLAARYSDSIIVMRAGQIVAEGPPRDVLTADLLASAFGLASQIVTDPIGGTPMVVPIGRRCTSVRS